MNEEDENQREIARILQEEANQFDNSNANAGSAAMMGGGPQASVGGAYGPAGQDDGGIRAPD